MKNHNKKQHHHSPSLDIGNAWVLTTKRAGDKVAGWKIEQLYKQHTRQLKTSERCELTSFCYPTGSKVVRATLQRQ